MDEKDKTLGDIFEDILKLSQEIDKEIDKTIEKLKSRKGVNNNERTI